MTMMREVVRVERLEKRFATADGPTVLALHDVNVSIRAGEWVAVVGPSGSGKSTFLHIIGLLDSATSGSYRFEGTDVATMSDRKRAGLRGRRIGFVFQAFHLLAYRSVVENVMLADVYRHGPPRDRRARALATLERVAMSHRADYLPPRLSGGERQRVAIARALLGSPSLLLCDEPTGNLDSATAESVLALLAELNRDSMTIVMITHDHQVAARAERTLTLIDGRLSELSSTIRRAP